MKRCGVDLRDSAKRVDEVDPAEIPTKQVRGLTGSELALGAARGAVIADPLRDSAKRVDGVDPADIHPTSIQRAWNYADLASELRLSRRSRSSS